MLVEGFQVYQEPILKDVHKRKMYTQPVLKKYILKIPFVGLNDWDELSVYLNQIM